MHALETDRASGGQATGGHRTDSSKQPRYAPPSRAPFEGFGNALTTAVEIVVVTAVGYWLGSRLGGHIGGAIGLTLAAAASFLRLYYRMAPYESPLKKAKAASLGSGAGASIEAGTPIEKGPQRQADVAPAFEQTIGEDEDTVSGSGY
jgi:hypothetical protein